MYSSLARRVREAARQSRVLLYGENKQRGPGGVGAEEYCKSPCTPPVSCVYRWWWSKFLFEKINASPT